MGQRRAPRRQTSTALADALAPLTRVVCIGRQSGSLLRDSADPPGPVSAARPGRGAVHASSRRRGRAPLLRGAEVGDSSVATPCAQGGRAHPASPTFYPARHEAPRHRRDPLSLSQLDLHRLLWSAASRRALGGPATLSGVLSHEASVRRIVYDATGEPSRASPAATATLSRAVESHRDGPALTVAGYEQIELGLAVALAKHAEDAPGCRSSDPAAARGVLLRGVAPGSRPSRHPASDPPSPPRQRYRAREPGRRARAPGVPSAAPARTTGGHVVYRACVRGPHHGWPRLNGWVSEKRQHLATARAIETAAQRWLDSGQDHGWLLTGQALAEARTMRAAVDAGGSRPRALAGRGRVRGGL